MSMTMMMINLVAVAVNHIHFLRWVWRLRNTDEFNAALLNSRRGTSISGRRWRFGLWHRSRFSSLWHICTSLHYDKYNERFVKHRSTNRPGAPYNNNNKSVHTAPRWRKNFEDTFWYDPWKWRADRQKHAENNNKPRALTLTSSYFALKRRQTSPFSFATYQNSLIIPWPN